MIFHSVYDSGLSGVDSVVHTNTCWGRICHQTAHHRIRVSHSTMQCSVLELLTYTVDHVWKPVLFFQMIMNDRIYSRLICRFQFFCVGVVDIISGKGLTLGTYVRWIYNHKFMFIYLHIYFLNPLENCLVTSYSENVVRQYCK